MESEFLLYPEEGEATGQESEEPKCDSTSGKPLQISPNNYDASKTMHKLLPNSVICDGEGCSCDSPLSTLDYSSGKAEKDPVTNSVEEMLDNDNLEMHSMGLNAHPVTKTLFSESDRSTAFVREIRAQVSEFIL